jgi:outer membrane protein assembly factor BamB
MLVLQMYGLQGIKFDHQDAKIIFHQLYRNVMQQRERIYFYASRSLYNFLFPLGAPIAFVLLCATLFAPEGVCNDSWSQFRGEGRNGHVHVPVGSMKWVEPMPELLWSQDIGSGFSEVVVADDRIYLMMAEKTDSVSGWETLVCMDAITGAWIWSTRVDDVYIDVDEWGDGPRSTPALDGQLVYCLSASGKLAAVDRADGQIVWKVDFVEQFGSTPPRWGYSTSPLVLGDRVIIEVGGENNHGFAAFDRATGEVKWHGANVPAGYNSAMAANVNGLQKIIFASGSTLHAFDAGGDSLWTYTMPLRSPMAMPLFIEPDMLFVSAANDAGSFIINLGNNHPEEVMRSTQMKNDWSSSCYKDGYIYGFNVAALQCIDAATGQRKWLKRGFGKGSLILVGDRLFVLSDTGNLTLVQATPDAYNELATVEALEGRSWTAPSYANGRIYVRNHTRIVCFRVMQVEG